MEKELTKNQLKKIYAVTAITYIIGIILLFINLETAIIFLLAGTILLFFDINLKKNTDVQQFTQKTKKTLRALGIIIIITSIISIIISDALTESIILLITGTITLINGLIKK